MGTVMTTSNVLSDRGTTVASGLAGAGGSKETSTLMSARKPAPWTRIRSPADPQFGFGVTVGHGSENGALAEICVAPTTGCVAVIGYGAERAGLAGTAMVVVKLPFWLIDWPGTTT